MDEAFASPDSDGHASLPSPTDTTFDLNDLPFRRRGRQGEHQSIIISSSFLQTEEDSDDDDYIPIPKTNKDDSDSIQSPPPVMQNLSNILAPINANNPNPQRPQSRNAPGSLLAQEGLSENIDPEENGVGGKMAAGGRSELAHESSDDDGPPEPIVVLEHEERYEQHQQETEENDRTVAHLGQAPEMNAHNLQQSEEVGDDQQLRTVITQLQDKLKNTEESHRTESEAREAKYTNLLEEQNALVKHLQAELDEMVNLMPVDHGSSRMMEEEEAGEWPEDKSREISQYYDDGLNQIITELHGGGEREDFDEAALEAEMSLRRVAEEAGLDEPLDKTTLAAFGIRQLRTESVLLKRLLIESEGRVKELMQANDEMGRRGEQMKGKIGVLEGEKEAIKRTVAEAEEKAEKHSEELEALKAKLIETETRIRQSTLEKGELSKKNRDLESRVKALEDDKSSLQRLVNDTKHLNEILKTQHSEEEKRAQSFEEEILGLRRQLAEENEHVGVIETETLSLRQQIAELEETSSLLEKSKEDLETRAKRIPTFEKEIRLLESKLADLEAASNEKANEDFDALSLQLQSLEEKLRFANDQHQTSTSTITHLQQALSTTELATRKLTKEKESLRNDLDKAAQESKASRIRFAQLLHDTAEREAKWNASRQAQDLQSHRQTAAFEDLLSEIYDAEILSQVGGDKVAMLREVLERRGRVAREGDEKVRRYKAAAKKWAKDCERNKGRIEELVAEVKELELKLKAEKKSCDEKMGQLILALRKE